VNICLINQAAIKTITITIAEMKLPKK